MKTKQCTRCNEIKTLDQFYTLNKTRANGEEYVYYFPYCKQCNIESAGEYRRNNKEKHVKSTQKYYRNNPEAYDKVKERVKKRREEGHQLQWQRENKDRLKLYGQQRQNHKISKVEWESCLKYFDYQCAYCGLTQEETKEQQGQFLHKEHVINDGANDLSNCIPSCKSCNCSKYTKDIDDWYNNDNPIYSKRRYNKILKWLNEDYKWYIKL